MIQEADTNGDGRIDYQEFVAYWRSGVLKMRMKRLRGFAKRASGAVAVIKHMMNLAKARQATRSNSHPGAAAGIVAPCARNPGDTYMDAAGVTTSIVPSTERVQGTPSAESMSSAVDPRASGDSMVAPLLKGGTARSVVASTAYTSLEMPADARDRMPPPAAPVPPLPAPLFPPNEGEADA
jgi:hypothetical protein